VLRFSLAGVQLKFSAVTEASGGLTIPRVAWVDHGSSSCIPPFPAVQRTNFAMLELARRVGIRCPENRLVRWRTSRASGRGTRTRGQALAVRRFDVCRRAVLHMEDFAQVFGQFPDNKYKFHSYANIASVLWPKRVTTPLGVRPPSRFLGADWQCLTCT